jgi:hypothetical protein
MQFINCIYGTSYKLAPARGNLKVNKEDHNEFQMRLPCIYGIPF